MKRLVLFLMMLLTGIVYSLPLSKRIEPSVNVVDTYQKSQDSILAMSGYVTAITTAMNNLGQGVDIAVQISNLQSLQDVAKVGGAICKLCNKSEQKQLQDYINQVNDDLCSQFGLAIHNITGIQKTMKSLQDIITVFRTNPKEAGLALQTASIQAQSAIQSSLAQVQMLIAQNAQKQLAEEKLAKQNNEDIYAGFRQSGL